MSEEAHLDEVKSLLTAAGASPHTLGELAALTALPAYYTEVMVMRRETGAPRRGGAASQVTGWRVLTRAVAKDYINALEMRRRTFAALHEAALTVDGESFFVEHAVTDDPIGPDDGWFSGTSEFTY
ncbi:hypothetical protein [Nocardioides sp. REDSEA-S30_B4]|uniref:hypothetical protein n=1 Tax=Nocardioides sp. REDSEA-S30_B4 TaxID=1811552 RepID=UPI000A72EBB5|nr:hypothetical protein [Nocardioides sp. REDSEA-S30_B4]